MVIKNTVKMWSLALQLAGFSPVALLSSSQVWPRVISAPPYFLSSL